MARGKKLFQCLCAWFDCAYLKGGDGRGGDHDVKGQREFCLPSSLFLRRGSPQQWFEGYRWIVSAVVTVLWSRNLSFFVAAKNPTVKEEHRFYNYVIGYSGSSPCWRYWTMQVAFLHSPNSFSIGKKYIYINKCIYLSIASNSKQIIYILLFYVNVENKCWKRRSVRSLRTTKFWEP